jgi:hypothetical protein
MEKRNLIGPLNKKKGQLDKPDISKHIIDNRYFKSMEGDRTLETTRSPTYMSTEGGVGNHILKGGRGVITRGMTDTLGMDGSLDTRNNAVRVREVSGKADII